MKIPFPEEKDRQSDTSIKASNILCKSLTRPVKTLEVPGFQESIRSCTCHEFSSFERKTVIMTSFK